ncbi:hypothetical protein B5C34_08545 [Pacificimonas flava]|uniref:DUF1993 domain-containing protein n=2 Tax=Pacificimonas TaxID=1960290 RepID=A0A219B544_9SPHN|nr:MULTISPECIES: DUF1993 domain-containing protein [Pacificimonas]MBZ6379288.1 DUF1993 domain-containing protein [Pacificimonas aurantium]OWV33502.1 hypothetical protein B5C34_08545 [Pacificimonas flava]
MTPLKLLLPSYVQMLERLSAWLGKAAHGLPDGEADALLSAKLAPDMFPLSTQVRFACVQAYEGVSRLLGHELPAKVAELLEEGRNAGEAPGSMANAQARITETVTMLNGVSESQLAAAEASDPQRPLAHELPNGMIFDLTAETYARDWAVPQFYFHVMTAYAILRSRGVELGKADYVAHLLPHLRPGTAPTA